MAKREVTVRFNRLAGLRKRLARIEHLMHPPAPEINEDEPFCEEEHLAHFRNHASMGFFRDETDFPQALREFEEALARARQDPQFMPPVEFMPTEPEIRRRRYWRQSREDRELYQSGLWLNAMWTRVVQGIPAVTLKEWEAMTSWYQQHRAMLPKSWTVKVGEKEYNLHEVDTLRSHDARDFEAGVHLMVLRELFARFHTAHLPDNNALNETE